MGETYTRRGHTNEGTHTWRDIHTDVHIHGRDTHKKGHTHGGILKRGSNRGVRSIVSSRSSQNKKKKANAEKTEEKN